jgi:Cu2+-exporting ATPase
LQFCCAGCRAVYEAINAHGLERYYQLQQGDPGKPSPARPTGRAYAELDDREFLDAHAPLIAPGLRSTELYLEGIHCSACVWLVEKLPRVAPGVIESRLDMRRALVKVVWEENKSNLPSIARTLDSLGYTPHAGRDSSSRNLRQREDRNLLVRIAIAGAGAGNVMLLAFALYGGSFHGMEHEYSSLFRWMSMGIGLIVLLWPGSLFFRGAWAALRTRTAHLDLPIAIGLGAGTVAGTVNTLLDRGEIYFDSLTSLVFLLLVGRYIQRRLERRAADTVELLFSLTPSFARLREGAECRDVPIEALKLEQIIEVRPGESFPADGDVVEGDSSVDLSLLTGESHPVPVCPGERIFAGSVNVDRILLARISALGKDTRVGKLLILMEECAQRKAPIVRLADRMAGYFTLGAIVLFAATLIGWHFVDPKRAVDNALSLLIVTCPCGLGLATPFAVAVALGRAARASILVKGGDVLEKLAASCRAGGTVFLDKTGTLTEPGLAVVAWHGDDTIRDQVAALEAQVSHPIARAIAGVVERRTVESGQAVLSKASPRGIEGQTDGMHFKIGSESFVLQSRLDDSSMSSSDPAGPEACLGPAYPVAGPEESSLSPSLDGHRLDLQSIAPDWAIAARREMTSKCLTPVWVSVNGSVAAVIGVGSRLRDDATKTIQDLREMGHKVQILSGDDPDTVGSLGRQLGMASQDCRGGLSPEDKLHIIEAATAPAFMVGDGVNDAAALSAASVGIAVHGGAEASLAAADVYLGRPGVAVLIELFEGSRRTLNVIRRCLRVSLGYNLVAAALATTGLINPLVAAILMPLASFTVLGIALGSRTFAAMESRPELDRLSAVSYQPSAGNSEIHPADS